MDVHPVIGTGKMTESATSPQLVTASGPLRDALGTARRCGQSIGLVPTMGALHQGHLSLVEASLGECDVTVVTIFVNPTQFGPHEDFAAYPRPLEADLAKLSQLGVHWVFAPKVDQIYRAGHSTYVEVGTQAQSLEGAHRHGHFRGVATVVLKLFNLVQPDVAYFGHKDYQQSLVIGQLIDDFDLPIRLSVCPIVREARRPRSQFAKRVSRRSGPPTGTRLVAKFTTRGALGVRRGAFADVILSQMRALFEALPEVELDYLALVRQGTVEPVERVDQPTVAVVAARVGPARLIDNRILLPPTDHRGDSSENPS